MASHEARPLVMEMELQEDFEDASGSSSCGCFHCFGFKKWWQGHDEEGRGLLENKGTEGESWVVNKLRKTKEFTEVIAGPRWKTFIRKISGYGKKQQRKRFQYDEHSYALNFNSGAQSEDEGMPHSFSARFAAPGRRQNES